MSGYTMPWLRAAQRLQLRRAEDSAAPRRTSGRRVKRVLLICDFGPGLLDEILTPYEHMRDTEVTLVRKKHGEVAVPSRVRMVRVPLPVIGTSDGMGVLRYLLLALNTVAYVTVGSLLAAYAALRFRCDVIHARFIFPQGVVGLVASIISRSKLVVTAEGSDINLYLRSGVARGVLRMLARRGEFVSVSKPIHDELLRFGVRSQCIPNSVDGAAFRFVPVDRKEKAVLFIGNLTPSKNPQTLIEAASLIHRFLSANGISVTIIGDGPLKAPLRQMVSRLGLEDVVTLEGILPHRQVRDYLARSYVYVSCSKGEGMSLAFLEAMASGCILLATNIPANAALIRDGETGFLFEVGDAQALAESIRNAFLNREALALVTQRARQSFDAQYDSEKTSATLGALYERLESARPVWDRGRAPAREEGIAC